MKDRVANITRWILYAMLFIGALAGVLFYTGGLGSQDGTGTSIFLYLGTLFFYLAIIVLIVTPIYTIFNNPQNLKKMLISAGILVVIVVISYAIAGNSFSPLFLEKHNNTSAETSRLVGMGLYVVYTVFGLSILSIIYSAIVKIIR